MPETDEKGKRKGSAVLTLIWPEEPRSTAEDQRLC